MKEEVLQSKVALVDEIKDKIENSHSIVLVNYRGLNVEEVTELRAKYREAGVDYKVYKNTMMRRAFEELGHDEIGEFLKGPSAIAFGTEDPVSPAKITADFAKDHEALEIKAGFMDGAVMDQKAIEDLAKLPSKEELIGKFLGGLNSPLQGMVNVMNGTLKGFVVALNAIAEKKKEEETA